MCCCSSVRCSALMSNQSEHFPHNLFSEQYSRFSAREFSKVFSNETGSERYGEIEDRKERMSTFFLARGLVKSGCYGSMLPTTQLSAPTSDCLRFPLIHYPRGKCVCDNPDLNCDYCFCHKFEPHWLSLYEQESLR